MEPTVDPVSGQPLPTDAIQRVLFVGPKVHVYNIPPLTSTKGYTASQWTADGNKRLIFTARARVVETAWEEEEEDKGNQGSASAARDRLKVDVLLEDPASGQLFAAAPITTTTTVESVLDSSRFFALTVQDPSGRKAVLGIGFEERGEAFDFGVALQEAKRGLGLDGAQQQQKQQQNGGASTNETEKKDYSLKEGETITINLGGKFARRRPSPQQQDSASSSSGDLSSFALPPPPGSSSSTSSSSSFLPPPPAPASSNARTQREQKRLSAQNLGFDDGKFGEFA